MARPAAPVRPPVVTCGMALLEVDALSVAFGRARMNTVDTVSFSLRRGETLGLVGESGCGKSVTALALMGLLPRPAARVSGGKVLFEGQEILRLPERRRADLRGDRMAMIFQEPMTSLNPAFKIGDQIEEAITRHRRIGRAQAREHTLEMLRRVRIPEPAARARAYPHELSGGMRQRVMIAMALANAPDVLVADEPTTALDVTIQAQILRLIRDLREEEKTAVLLITHDLGVVAEAADRVAVMYAGRIAEAGPVRSIFADPQHPYTIGLMGSLPATGRRTERLVTIEGAVPSIGAMPPGCRFAPRCPFADARCHAEQPPPTNPSPGHVVHCWKAPLEVNVAAAA